MVVWWYGGWWLVVGGGWWLIGGWWCGSWASQSAVGASTGTTVGRYQKQKQHISQQRKIQKGEALPSVNNAAEI
jgi:hypothetical protein